MSGLIWAGIGKGIADAGATFGNSMMKGIEEERRMQQEALREDRLIKREEEREQRKEDRLEAAAKKDAEIFRKAEEAAPAIGDKRRFEKFKADVGQTDMSEEELRSVFDSQYNQRKVGNFEGADRYVERYSKQKEDVLNEIRGLGGSSGLINQATNVYKATLEAERAADKQALDEKREDRRDREARDRYEQTDRRLDILSRNADSNRIRAERPSGGGADGGAAKVRSTYTDDSGQKVAVMSDGSTKVLGKAADYNKSVANLIAQREKTDFQFKNLSEEEKKSWAAGRLASGAPVIRSSDNSGSRPPLSSFNR